MGIFFFNPVLIAAAVIPAVALMIRVYRADRLDREPTGLLISLILLGVFSTVLAGGAEQIGIALLDRQMQAGTPEYNAVQYFVIVGISEECFKYLLLRLRTWHSRSFDCRFDAIVYAVFVSLGFALWENIGYVFIYGFGTAVLRAVTAVPGHACFGVFMGIWYGAAKKYDNAGRKGLSVFCRIMSVVFPAFLHGCYDFAASIEDVSYAWVFYVFVAVMFVISFRLIKKMSDTDTYIS